MKSEDKTNQRRELRGVIQLLKATAQMAEHSSLTGSLGNGAGAGVRQYNAVLKRFSETGIVPEYLFAPLYQETSFDELGVLCKQLAGYLKGYVSDAAEEGEGIVIPDLRHLGEEIREATGGIPGEVSKALRESLRSLTGTEPEAEKTASDTAEQPPEKDKNTAGEQRRTPAQEGTQAQERGSPE